MEIGGLQKTTLIDYPGRVAATVFLISCNFRCPFCYSAELVLPEKIKKQPRISEKDFFDFLKERKGLLDGVVICGGEPTIHKDLPEFIKKIKKMGFLVKLDTNGSNPEMLKKLIDPPPLLWRKSGGGLVDYVAMDIKQSQISTHSTGSGLMVSHVEPSNLKSQKYDKATGVKVNLKRIKKSVEILKENKVDFEFRSTVVPLIHTKEDILEIAKWIGGPKVRYYLQNFRPEKTLDPEFTKLKPYPEEFLKEIQKEISPFFEICQVR